MKTAKDLEDTYGIATYPKRDVTIVRGREATLWDTDGREYIDCMSGMGVANIGHSHPKLIEAVQHQVSELTVCSTSLYHSARGELCQRLAELSPGNLSQTYLCNSGAEAVEAMLKFSWISTGRRKVVSLMRAFHGRTLGALSTTFNPKYRKPFLPLAPDVTFVPVGNIEKLREAVTDEVAAVVVEVVQGDGGLHPLSAEFLYAARDIAKSQGALFVVDEIQTGIGRTGKLFACEHHDLVPDLLCLAKGLGAGIPIGAVMAGPDFSLPVGIHGSTFGGNPVACRAALAVLDVVTEPGFLDEVNRKGDEFIAKLRAIESPKIREVRGLGLMVGIELKEKVAPYLKALTERGVLVLPAGATVLRFLPPLVITGDQLEKVATVIEEVLLN